MDSSYIRQNIDSEFFQHIEFFPVCNFFPKLRFLLRLFWKGEGKGHLGVSFLEHMLTPEFCPNAMSKMFNQNIAFRKSRTVNITVNCICTQSNHFRKRIKSQAALLPLSQTQVMYQLLGYITSSCSWILNAWMISHIKKDSLHIQNRLSGIGFSLPTFSLAS